jgi:glycosyltransferase involved in cell wall biosynthesis
MLISLKASLYGQITTEKAEKEVEVICLADNGEKSTGWKRNMLLQKAKGDYVVFVDDDDEVHSKYVHLINKTLFFNSPDVIGIVLKHYQNDTLIGTAYHSVQYKKWRNLRDPDNLGQWLFERCPNHLNPVRRELALKIRFPEIYVGEDKEYSLRLREFLKEEVMINEPIYFYKEVI